MEFIKINNMEDLFYKQSKLILEKYEDAKEKVIEDIRNMSIDSALNFWAAHYTHIDKLSKIASQYDMLEKLYFQWNKLDNGKEVILK